MAEITWSAQTYCDCDCDEWFFFDVERTKTFTTGTSANNFTVYIDKATSPNDCSNGYVGISSTTIDGEIEETIIPVTRCLPKCNCTIAAFSSDIDGKEFEDDFEETISAGTYNSGVCGTVDAIVGGTIFDRSSINVSNGKITIKVTANTTFDKRYDFFRFTLNGKTCYSGSISQSAKVNTCLTSSTVSVLPDVIRDTTCSGDTFNYTISDDCWFVKKVNIDPIDLATIDIDNQKITVTENPLYEERTGLCTLTLQNGTNGIEYQEEIEIIQSGCDVPPQCTDVTYSPSEKCILCDCNKDDFNLIESVINDIPTEGGTYTIATVNKCISDTIAVDESENWNCGFSFGEEVIVTVPATGEGRSETITFSYSAKCNTEIWQKTLILNQAGGSVICNCESITYGGTEEEDPTPPTPPPTPTGRLKIEIQIKNNTSSDVYWDEIHLNFADGNTEDPETCDGCPAGQTVTWNYGGSSSHDDWISLVNYSSTDTPTLSSVSMHCTDSDCNGSQGEATLSFTETVLHNGETILLTYNGND